MGTPLLVDAWERPATTSVIIVCCLVWYYLHRHGLGYEDVGVSYRKAVVEGQYWRCITASFSHVSLIHLLFNMSSLWSLGVVEKMGRLNSKGDTEWGTACYVRYTVVMLIGTMAVVLGVTHLLIKHFKLERYEHVTSVGYSCVVFGWMTVLSVKNPTHVFSVGPVGSNISLPVNLAPFGSLIFTSIVVPQASFVGHLSGIFVGYLIAWVEHQCSRFISTQSLVLHPLSVSVQEQPVRSQPLTQVHVQTIQKHLAAATTCARLLRRSHR